MLQHLLPTSTTRVIVYLKPVSMRLGPAKLREICRESMGIEPDSRTAFLFTNKARDCLLMYFADVEHDHRFVKQKMVAALGFQTFYTARATLAGVELVHMVRKGQVRPVPDGSDADQFFALAA